MEAKLDDETQCFVATVTNRQAVSGFDSRLTIKRPRPLHQASIRQIIQLASGTRWERALPTRISDDKEYSMLTPKLSAYLIRRLGEFKENEHALRTVVHMLPELRTKERNRWAQDDAIHTAVTALGIQGEPIAERLSVPSDPNSILHSYFDDTLYEETRNIRLNENGIPLQDVSAIPGFEFIDGLVSGWAKFSNGSDELTVYTANRVPLEEVSGFDLIYYNEIRDSVVVVQYVGVVDGESAKGTGDQVFHPDGQMRSEIRKRLAPKPNTVADFYRLSADPFYFMFVGREALNGKPKTFIVPHAHVDLMLTDQDKLDAGGGVRISYDSLNGGYLRRADLAGLIRSGYIGSHPPATQVLTTILEEVSRGTRGIVLAWQRPTPVDLEEDEADGHSE